MCGIVGVLQPGCEVPPGRIETVIEAMAETLRHRGIDGSGRWVDRAWGIGFGHRRLAIIDLSDNGAQPMQSADGRYVITFNGEIYNHLELRAELGSQGHRFRGTSDTEVMLAGFVEWGLAGALPRFAGMFAFALWDRVGRCLTLARDRLGEKPLYYGWLDRSLVFGSELKAIRVHPSWKGEIDRNVLALYCRTNYVPAPYSIYRGIWKLEPGTTVTFMAERITPGTIPAPTAYWSLKEVIQTAGKARFCGTEDEAADRLEEILRSVIKSQMLSDVPLGALLSGGVDSSTVVAIMQEQSRRPVRTFTVRFDDPVYDEADSARAVATHLGTDHTEIEVSASEAMNVIPRIPEWYDEPFADSSQIPTALVAQLARRHVTVCLTGDGGDEVFCGYNRLVRLRSLWDRLKWVPRPLRIPVAWAARNLPFVIYEWYLRSRRVGFLGDQVQKFAAVLKSRDLESAYIALSSFWPDPTTMVKSSVDLPTLLTDCRQWPTFSEPMDRLMYVEMMTSLPDGMLVKVDRAAMAMSLETRAPLLDHRVVEFAWSLPLEFKVKGDRGKQILRRVLKRHVPSRLIERPKWGFGPPIDSWLQGPLREWAENLLNPSRLHADGFFDPVLVRRCWDAHLRGRRKCHEQLWGILMFQAWLDEQRRPSSAAA